MTKGTKWQMRAKAAGLSQKMIADLIEASEVSISRGISAAKVPQKIKMVIVAWEILTPEQRSQWLQTMGAMWVRDEPKKKAARMKVARAIATGSMTRPTACSRCGADACKIEAHHDDYDRPLDVMWLCRACHADRHAEIGSPVDWRPRDQSGDASETEPTQSQAVASPHRVGQVS